MAERVGFEPTCPLLAGKTLSRRPRYDRFGTSPRWVVAPGLRYRPRAVSFQRSAISGPRRFVLIADG